MSRITFPLCLLLLIHSFARAEAPATQPSGVTGTLGKPENTAKIAAVVGRSGVLLVRSEVRWDELNTLLPGLTPDTPLPKFDFAKQDVVLVYDTRCRSKDTFELTKPDLPNMGLPPETSQTDFFLHWDNSPEEQKEFRYAKFILTNIPAMTTVWVSVLSRPLTVRPTRPPALDVDTRFGCKDGGDIVDGLQANITPKAAAIKPGEDILIDFALRLAHQRLPLPVRFGTAPDAVHVWDGSTPEGYRNHAFFITAPDGKTTLLRPKEIQWKRTPIPRAVEITAPNAYHLPSGSGNFKSLKDMGLDTTAPGTYVITGLYEEIADTHTTPDGKKIPLWGGSIVSNTVTVEVKK